DLYFRLNVVQITMPPLRNRKEDLPLLVQAFLKESSQENGKPPREFAPEAMAAILDYNWPGNVRELRAAVEHAVVMCSSSRIGVRDLPASIRQGTPALLAPGGVFEQPGGLNLHQTERNLIFRALEESGGNRTGAAQRLGISRRTLHRRLKELQITKNPTP
nr:helix-turn-helix domain-containing protein [Terrimicrobiaceae bacterium]